MEHFIETIQKAVREHGGQMTIFDLYLRDYPYLSYKDKQTSIKVKLFTMTGIDGEIVNSKGEVLQKVSVNYEDISSIKLHFLSWRIRDLHMVKIYYEEERESYIKKIESHGGGCLIENNSTMTLNDLYVILSNLEEAAERDRLFNEDHRRALKRTHYNDLKNILDTLGLDYIVVTHLEEYLQNETPENASLFSFGQYEYYYGDGISKRKVK
jgi:hypothetical protein